MVCRSRRVAVGHADLSRRRNPFMDSALQVCFDLLSLFFRRTDDDSSLNLIYCQMVGDRSSLSFHALLNIYDRLHSTLTGVAGSSYFSAVKNTFAAAYIGIFHLKFSLFVSGLLNI